MVSIFRLYSLMIGDSELLGMQHSISIIPIQRHSSLQPLDGEWKNNH